MTEFLLPPDDPIALALARLYSVIEGANETVREAANVIAESRAQLSALREENERLKADDRTLRQHWWLGHVCSSDSLGRLYGDDGEMTCSACMTDFRREAVSVIAERLHLLALERLAKNPKALEILNAFGSPPLDRERSNG